MSLLIDDIRPYKEFLIRGCREVYILDKNTFILQAVIYTHVHVHVHK